MNNITNHSEEEFEEEFYFVIIWDLCVGFLGLVANCILMYLLFKSKSFNKNYDILLANQCLSDLVCSAAILTSSIYSLILHTSTLEVGKDAACKIIYFLMITTFLASVFIFTVIAMERYYSYVLKKYFTRSTRFKKIVLGIMLIWIISAGVAFPIIYFTGAHEPSLFSCTLSEDIIFSNYDKLFFTLLVCLFYLLPVLIMCICYLLLMYSICKKIEMLQNAYAANIFRSHARERRVIWFSLILTMAFLLLSSPFLSSLLYTAYADTNLYESLLNSNFSQRLAVEICTVIYKSRCMVIALLHIGFRKPLRQAIYNGWSQTENKTE